MTYQKEIDQANDILDRVYDEHNPVAVYGAFSGGHDSLTSTHLLSQKDYFDGVLHINTGIGITETREFVRDKCKKYDWDLMELSPQDAKDHGYSAKTYKEFVMDEGFPGPAAHIYAYSWLKERPIRVFKSRIKENHDDEIMLVTGVRKQESQRRMGNTAPKTKDGSLIWTAPITNWSQSEVNRYRELNQLQRNEVVDKLHMSGECLCGAFARPDELEEIRFWYPEVAEYIEELQDQAEENGVWNHWGKRPDEYDPDQIEMRPMCSDCPDTRIKKEAE